MSSKRPRREGEARVRRYGWRLMWPTVLPSRGTESTCAPKDWKKRQWAYRTSVRIGPFIGRVVVVVVEWLDPGGDSDRCR